MLNYMRLLKTFFTKSNGPQYQELLYIYTVTMDLPEQLPEGFTWLPFNNIDAIKPSCLAQLIEYQDTIRHFIHYDK